jgi:hypothetical protein
LLNEIIECLLMKYSKDFVFACVSNK